jgi:hypothetical protein
MQAVARETNLQESHPRGECRPGHPPPKWCWI